ncbi:unnamed protein product, partial [Didymodactylos carnosus]
FYSCKLALVMDSLPDINIKLSSPIPVSTTISTTTTTTTENDNKNKCLKIFHNRHLLLCAMYFALAYFIQGVTDIASGFVNLPLQTILKDYLKLHPSEMSAFFFFCTITWSIKPLYGLLSDFVPILGYHRLIYLLATTIINFISWIALFVCPLEYDYLLLFCILCAF